MRGVAYEGGRGGHDHATGIKVRLIGGLSASGYPPRQIVAFEDGRPSIGGRYSVPGNGMLIRYEIWSLPVVKICRPLRSSVSKTVQIERRNPFITAPASFFVKSYPARQSGRQTKSSLASIAPDRGVAPPASQ